MPDRYNQPADGSQNWDVPVNENFADLDVDVEHRGLDTDKSNVTAADGAKYLATDTGQIYLGDGTNWNPEWDLGAIGNSGLSDPASTISVPTDQPTVAAALGHILDNYATIGHTVNINIESGHELQDSFSHRRRRNLNHVTITSDDSEVFLSDNIESGKNVFQFFHTYSPVFDIVLNGNGWMGNTHYDGRLYLFRDGAVGLFEGSGTPPIAGGKNAAYGVSAIACATVTARGSIWQNMTNRGVSISNSSWGYFQDSTVTDCDKNFRIDAAQLLVGNSTLTNGTYGLWISSPSIISANNIDASGNYNGIRAQGGACVQANDATINNTTGAALYAREGSTIAARGLSSDGCDRAIQSHHGSTITVEGGGGTISNTIDQAIEAEYGSIVKMSGTVDGAGTQGVFANQNSLIDVGGTDITNSSLDGVLAQSGSRITVGGGAISGSGGSGDLVVAHGGQIAFETGDTTTTSSTGTDPHESDMNVTPNTLQGQGIIFAENYESV